eukprot:TRINITY_DN26406_c0_g1_i1.p1 TRINITY_DN26406_c0_g1~~TRINITY_DN26406_c0_g1_i1.p1  ORF type:complete len:705 (+),score=264.17 TRINITY_DN26406_c0_g1_i1:59-2116(+)
MGVPPVVKGKKGCYRIGDTLGKGGFGIVKLAVNEKTGESFAAKVIDLCIAKRDNLLEYADREIRLAQQLKHPHIISLVEVVELREHNMRAYIMELAPNGELFDQIVAVSRFTESTARRYFQQLIAAVRYCHSQGVVHRDLKAENLLLSKDNTLKICDFGLSRYTGEEAFGDHPIMFSSIAGSLDYQAPEIVKNQKYHGKPADLWACGVILGFMLSGWLPFQGNQGEGDQATKQRILKNPPEYRLHKDISETARDLIKLCLNPDPSKRITADEVIQHPWFKVGLDNTLATKLKIPDKLLHDEACQISPGPSSPAVVHPYKENDIFHIDLSRFESVDKSLLRHLRIAFDIIDTDHSGVIKEEELRDVLIKLNNISGEEWIPTQEDVQTLLSFFMTQESEERAGEKGITFSEFVAGYVEKNVETACPLGERLKLQDLLEHLGEAPTLDLMSFDHEYIEKLREAFRQIDEDQTGVIHRKELGNLLSRAGIESRPEDIDTLFEYMDVSKHDFITFEEFASAWSSSQHEHSPTQTTSGNGNHKVHNNGADLLTRISKCTALVGLAEADEALRVLQQASNGCTVKGDCDAARELAKKAFQDTKLACHIDNIGTTNDRFFMRCCDDNGVVLCEVSVLIAPSICGYSTILTRRITGGTSNFHIMYKSYLANLTSTPEYTQAQADLEEDGTPVHI